MSDDGNDLEIQVKLTVDDSEVDPALAKVGAKTGQKLPPAKLDVDGRPATRELTELKAKSTALHSTIEKKATIHIDGSQGDRTLAELRAKSESINVQLEKLKASAVGTSFEVGGGAAAGRAGALGIGGTLAGAAPATMAAALPIAAIFAGIKQGIDATVPRTLDSIRMEGAVTRNFGASQGQEFLTASEALSEATGFLANDFRAAALAGRSLAAMSDDPAKAAKLQTDAIKQLLPVAADLAATSPDEALQSVAGAFTTMKSAIAGNVAAQQSLGVNLSEAYMQTQAFGGALRNTWADLSAAEQAQARYKEMLRQTKDIMGEAGDETSLEFQMRSFNQETGKLAEALGKEIIPRMRDFIAVINTLVDAIPDWVPKAVATAADIGWQGTKMAALALPGVQVPATATALAYGKAKDQTSVLSGALAHPGARPGYYPPAASPAQVNSPAAAAPVVNVDLVMQGQYPGVQFSVSPSPAAIQ